MTLDDMLNSEGNDVSTKGNLNACKNTSAELSDFISDDLKDRIARFHDREKSYRLMHLAEKRHLKKEYQAQYAEYIVNKFHWPKFVAKLTVKGMGIPADSNSKRQAFTNLLADLSIGYFIASWSERFLKPFADHRGKKITYYTNINIAADVFWLGASAAAIFGSKGNYDSELIQNFMNSVNYWCNEGKVISELVYANFYVRAIQIPVRTAYSVIKHKHTWSPATAIHPNIPESIGFMIVQCYDWAIRLDERYHIKDRYDAKVKEPYDKYIHNRIEKPGKPDEFYTTKYIMKTI